MATGKHLHDAACWTMTMETTWMLQHTQFMQMAATNDHGVSCLAFALSFWIGVYRAQTNGHFILAQLCQTCTFFSPTRGQRHPSHPERTASVREKRAGRHSMITRPQGKQIRSRGQMWLAGREAGVLQVKLWRNEHCEPGADASSDANGHARLA